MVAKVSLGNSLYGALVYNGEKINKEKGRVLDTNKIFNDGSGTINIHRAFEDFKRWMPQSTKAEKIMMHISLNQHPDDHLSEAQYTQLAHEYMDKMGFSEMPYIIVKHEDIDRHHIHIVALRVHTDGRAISSKNNFYRSKEITRALEKKYGLHTAERQKVSPDTPIIKIDCNGDIKRQVANVVKLVGMRWKFQTLGEYNAILSLYNVKCEAADGRVNGREYHGLIYFATDDSGNTIASPFKASRLGKFASRTAIESRFEKSKENIDVKPTKNMVSSAIHNSTGKDDFVSRLNEKKIDVIFRYTDEGRINGVTFLNHNSQIVLNGSRLGKEFSANAFERWFSGDGKKPDFQASDPNDVKASTTKSNDVNQQYDKYEQLTLPGLDLFQIGPGFNAEEEAFYRAMQRRKKKRRGPKL